VLPEGVDVVVEGDKVAVVEAVQPTTGVRIQHRVHLQLTGQVCTRHSEESIHTERGLNIRKYLDSNKTIIRRIPPRHKYGKE
jgi:hypothetical protein